MLWVYGGNPVMLPSGVEAGDFRARCLSRLTMKAIVGLMERSCIHEWDAEWWGTTLDISLLSSYAHPHMCPHTPTKPRTHACTTHTCMIQTKSMKIQFVNWWGFGLFYGEELLRCLLIQTQCQSRRDSASQNQNLVWPTESFSLWSWRLRVQDQGAGSMLFLRPLALVCKWRPTFVAHLPAAFPACPHSPVVFLLGLISPFLWQHHS